MNFDYDIGIINGELYIDGTFIKSNLYIKNDKISTISNDRFTCEQVIDAKGLMVLPGFIDPHVHFHLGVGTRKSKDDFYTGSQKAALGGITTYIDFLDPIKKAEEISCNFQERNKLAENSVTDYTFHTTIANPSDTPQKIIKASKDIGISSIKLFTTYSNTDRRTYDQYILELLKCSVDEGVQVLVHAENDDLISYEEKILVRDHEKSRPVESEVFEIKKLAAMARETGGNLYIVHISAGTSVQSLIQDYPIEILSKQITLESCPHYFIFDSQVYENEDGYKYTMTPPLRPEYEKKVLNNYIEYISTIGTDHCPFDEQFKNHRYTSEISMGIGGLQYSFLNMYTLFQDKIIGKFTEGPAMAYRLYPNKGSLLPGTDADIVLFDKHAQTIVKEKDSIYFGKRLQGAIKSVYLRGQLLVSDNQVFQLTGKYLRR